MKFQTNRQLCIFFALLETSESHAITSEQLARIAKTSVRTVKEEIGALKVMLKSGDMQINSKPGLGYYLTCQDEEKYRQVKDELVLRYRSASMIPTDFSQRVNYIIRSLLGAGGYVKMETLADGLFMNKKTLTKEFRAAKKMLSSYGIAVVTKPGYGMALETDAYHYRMCMVDYYQFYFHKINPTYLAAGFLEQFDFDFQERLEIRKVFMTKLMEFDIIVPDYCSQKLVIHLLLMRSRIRKGYGLDFAGEDLVRVRRFPEYRYARAIIGALQIFPDFDRLDENEVIYLAILLAAGKDPLSNAYNEQDYPEFYQEALASFEHLTGELLSEFCLDIKGDEYLTEDFLHVLVAIHMKARYEIKEIQGSPTITNHVGRNILQSPLCTCIALRLVHELELITAKNISEYDMLNLAYLVYNATAAVPLPVAKANLIVVPENSKFAMRSVISLLRRQLGEYINRIDIFAVYELRKINLDDYDGIITAHNISNFSFPKRLFQVNYFVEAQDCTTLFRDVILDKQHWSDRLPDILPERLYRNYKAESIEEFFRLLAMKHFAGPEAGEEFFARYQRYAEQYKLHSYQGVLVIPRLSCEAEECFELYEFEKGFLWHNNIVKYGIFLSAPSQDREKVRLMEIITRQLQHDSRYVEAILGGSGKTVYDTILKECIFRP